MNWFERDGEELAELIIDKLIDSENGKLEFEEIIEVYETDITRFGLRKTEGYAWNIINARKDIERFVDSRGKIGIRYKNPNLVRAYKLHDGDIFTTCDMILQYEDGVLHEMRKNYIDGYVTYMRTGKVLTMEEVNEIAKGLVNG